MPTVAREHGKLQKDTFRFDWAQACPGSGACHDRADYSVNMGLADGHGRESGKTSCSGWFNRTDLVEENDSLPEWATTAATARILRPGQEDGAEQTGRRRRGGIHHAILAGRQPDHSPGLVRITGPCAKSRP